MNLSVDRQNQFSSRPHHALAKRSELVAPLRQWMSPAYTAPLAFSFIALLCSADSQIAFGNERPDRSTHPAVTTGANQKAKLLETARTRYVHTNRSLIRSGPGTSFYPTDQIERGGVVEVYLETEDGWSGVRPPSGSYNWIPASSAYLLPGGKTAEIIHDDTPAWVGTPLKKAPKLLWQVSLHKSQIVQVLGEKKETTSDGTESLWYRIAPPQGEFRWVRSATLSDSQPPPVFASDDDSGEMSGSNSADGSAVQLASHNVVQASQSELADGEVVWSDEREVLAQINRQIRSEQGELNRQLPTGTSVPAEYGDVYLDDLHVDGSFIEGSIPTAMSVEEAMTPEDLKRAKRHKNAQHQVASLRHWDSLEAADPSLKVKPLNSLLGLIGFGVVEAEKMPINSQIAVEQNRFRSGEFVPSPTLENLGNTGNSRLDRLPRPGRAPRVTSPNPNRMHDPNAGAGWLGQTGGRPLDSAQPVLTRLWNSDQPMFGAPGVGYPGQYASSAPYGSVPYATDWMSGQPGIGGANPYSGMYSGMAANPGWNELMRQSGIAQAQPGQGSGFQSGADWYGIRSPSAMETSRVMADAFNDPLEDAEFQTPEIRNGMLELSRVISRPTEEWNLATLRQHCHQWIEQGGDSLVRGEARLLLDRIDRFDSLRERTLGASYDPARLAHSSSQSSSLSSSLSNSLANPMMGYDSAGSSSASHSAPVQLASSASSGKFAGGYDANAAGVVSANHSASNQPGLAQGDAGLGEASGWLVQVHGTVQGQPEFALTDDQGNVITYVQTTAALNIRRYLQQPVVVYGQRGYIPSLAAKLISVERIARLR